MIPGKIWNKTTKDYISQRSLNNHARGKSRENTQETYIDKKESNKLRRNASLEIILENGKINSHRGYEAKMNTSPRPGVFELKDIGINKQIITAIKKRTRAALQQTIQGEKKLKKNGTYKVFSPKTMKQMSKTRREKQTIQPYNARESIKRCSKANTNQE